jgi:hypothetical protein
MNMNKLGALLVLAAALSPAVACAGQPVPSTLVNAEVRGADVRWSSDGTRDALREELKRLLGNEKNTFGPLEGDGTPGVMPEGSELLGAFIGHVIGIPGPERVLANGEHFYSGAEAHNAEREAALITQYRGKGILAMAVFEGHATGGANTLAILFPGNRQPDPGIQEQFTSWAHQEIARQQAILRGSTLTHISGELVVETRTLGRP